MSGREAAGVSVGSDGIGARVLDRVPPGVLGSAATFAHLLL
ncbi:MAG: hypothetical protein ABI950_11520 [Solirubrobacteraceae bacterium]